MKEVWKPLYEFKYWEISNQGRIRKTFIAKPNVDAIGYARAHIGQGGMHRKVAVHRGVYEAFVGEIPPGLMINHKNGIKTDNRLENLELVTSRENIDHYKDNLLTYRGEKVNTAKLTEEDVKKIRKRKKLGVSTLQLAKEHGVALSTIKRVISRKNWRHVK